MRTEFIVASQGLSRIALEMSTEETLPEVQLFNITDNKEIPVSIQAQNQVLYLTFEPQAQSYRKTFSIHIEAPNVSKENAFFVPYESDATKYPTNTVWQGASEKQGSLGITEYEKPTVALLVARWLALPHQRPLWMGIAFIGIGICIRRYISETPRTILSIPSIHWGWFLGIWLVIVALYYPATSLFFYSDDVPILARTAYMAQHQPFLLFTPHQYQDADPRAAFGFDFWRPISFAIYPFLLHLLIPPSAWMYYILNIALFAGIGCFLFFIAHTAITSKPAALLAVSLWATNSAKLGVVYWWSSVQDILASLFAMAAIALYILWRSKNKNILLYMSVATYLLGVFSKEYVIVTPIAIAGLEMLLLKRNREHISWKNLLVQLSPFIIAAGAFLVLNTAVLGDPTLPARKHTDQTYSLTFSPKAVARNTIIYLSATAESKAWPHVQAIEDYLYRQFKLWEVKTSGPYYPGLALLIAGILLPLFFWKHKDVAYTAVFGVLWWILFMGPILLFANDWKLRWLMLATFGTGLAAAALLQQVLKKLPVAPLILCAILVVYGYQNARSEDLNRFYTEQSDYTREAYTQLKAQEQEISEEKRIILVGIIPEQETSLNAYLFRLYAKNPQADIIYRDSLPETKEVGDVIINMIGITPYYPDSEK